LEDGYFLKVPIFVGIKVAQLEAAVQTKATDGGGNAILRAGESYVRSNLNGHSSKSVQYAEVFAMDPNGIIYHLEVNFFIVVRTLLN
jgi:hypothetical protein